MNAIEDIIKETKKSSSLSNVSAIALAKRKKEVLYSRQYRLDNKENIKEYYLKNKESYAKRNRQYRLDNRESISKQKNKYYLANKEKRSLYKKARKKTDPTYRLIYNYRRRLGHALNGNIKSASSMELLGCTGAFFKKYIEQKFKPGMSWENRGSFHIDHIIPCASFDLSKPEEQRKCSHYTNLQPLSPIDNMRKGARY